jgi:endonuclease G
MTGTALVRAAIFTAGALVGGGVAAVISNKKQIPVYTPVPSSQVPPPIVEVDRTGKARFQEPQGTLVPAAHGTLSRALKYGNPGEFFSGAIYTLFLNARGCRTHC